LNLRTFTPSLALIAALTALSWRFMDMLGDTFWSIATGRLILELGRFPTVDPFSFTAGDQPWVAHMPAFQVVSAMIADGASRLGGAPIAPAGAEHPLPTHALLTLTFVASLVQGIALALLVLPYARTPAKLVLGGVLAAALIGSQQDDLCVRGQVFGDLGFALLLACVTRILDGKAVANWVPVLLGSAWVQFHSSFLLAIVLPLFLCGIEWAEGARKDRVRPLLRFGVLSAFGSLINPYSYRLPLDILALARAETTAKIDLLVRCQDIGNTRVPRHG